MKTIIQKEETNTTMYPYYYKLVCPQCDYTFASMHLWLISLKCSAHRRSFRGHLCGSGRADGRAYPPPQEMINRKEPYEPWISNVVDVDDVDNDNDKGGQ